MSNPIEIRVAPDGMPAVRCADCTGTVRPGHEFWIEQWPNQGGFDYHHFECPTIARSPDPSRRVVQGHDNPRRRR
jgi:hypothetical protein